MTCVQPLPAAPDADDLRALARSSPWRWRTARFTVRWTGAFRQLPLRAWVARPDSLRVERLDGTLVQAGVEQRGGSTQFGGLLPDDGAGMPQRYEDGVARARGGAIAMAPASRTLGPGFAEPRAVEPGVAESGVTVPRGAEPGGFGWLVPAPATLSGGSTPSSGADDDELVLRPDGLVARRPTMFGADVDDPMYQDYRWVAMLDPLELAEPVFSGTDEAEPATELSEIAVVDHHGRPAWEALVRVLPGYDPRCSCCPLLDSAAADALELDGGATPHRPADFAYPEAHRVRLDLGTGICVYTEEIGGSRPGTGHDLTLEAVDADMPAELFTAPRRRWGR